MTEAHCTITGRVQRVGYRAFVENAAAELGITGYAENKHDGSVYVVAQGEPEILRQFVEYLHEGSLLSKVDGVAVEWRTNNTPADDFSIVA
jgi:acylphosphatase